jgi:LysM repeat protein
LRSQWGTTRTGVRSNVRSHGQPGITETGQTSQDTPHDDDEEPAMSTLTISAGLGTRRPRASRPTRSTRGTSSTVSTRPTGALRLTRRGRLVTTLVLLAGFLTGGVLLSGGLATAGTEPGAAATAQRVTVAPGETLWSISERVAPDADPRDTVAEILELNHLQSSAVQAGSVLLLP